MDSGFFFCYCAGLANSKKSEKKKKKKKKKKETKSGSTCRPAGTNVEPIFCVLVSVFVGVSEIVLILLLQNTLGVLSGTPGWTGKVNKVKTR